MKKRIIAVLVVLALIISIVPEFTVDAQAATKKSKANNAYFTYRVDVLDKGLNVVGRGGEPGHVAVEVSSSVDGQVYIYVKKNGEKALTKEDVVSNGECTTIAAGEEAIAFGKIYWLDTIEVGELYDVYIAFEDAWGNTYGPYVEKKWEAKLFPAGDGSAKKPYQIWSEVHLNNLCEYCNQANVTYKLMQDLDLSKSRYGGGTVCGYASTFNGSFDGNGHTIAYLKKPLFYSIGATGFVYDLNMYGCDMDAHGVLCEETCKGRVKDCNFQYCDIYGNSLIEAGLIARNLSGTGEIKKCTVQWCNVKTSGAEAGGIVGIIYEGGLIEQCLSEANVSSEWNQCFVGGIAGECRNGTIQYCVSNPTALRGGTKGGIAGKVSGPKGAIIGCLSSWLPVNPLDIPGNGSIVGEVNLDYIANYMLNIGAVPVLNYVVTSATELLSGDIETIYKFMAYHGFVDVTTGLPIEGSPYIDSVTEYMAINIANVIEFTGLHFIIENSLSNETKAYNKKFPVKEKTIKLKSTKSTLAAPKSFSGKYNKKKDIITLSWKKVSKADGYAIYTCESQYGNYELSETITSGNTVKFEDKYFDHTDWYYRIRPYKEVNGKKVYGAFSNIVHVNANR